MILNFEFVLTIATVFTGVIVALEKFRWAKQRAAAAEKNIEVSAQSPTWIEYCRSFFPILLIVLIIRSFLFEPFRIPSGSMKPTLTEGDFILVNKYTYGIRLPVLGTKIVSLNEPQRGDVFVFRNPETPSINMIKRVIGLPGDVIRYDNKRLTINGQPVPVEIIGESVDQTEQIDVPVAVGLEHLGNVNHDVYFYPIRPEPAQEWVIPEGHYFGMGDNRDNSRDSRHWGMIPEDYLIGRAVFIWMNWHSRPNQSFWQDFSWGRVGTKIE